MPTQRRYNKAERGICQACGKAISKFDDGWHHIEAVQAKKHTTVWRRRKESHLAVPK